MTTVSDDLLTILIPMLTDRPKRKFDIFAVMRHGTHEKQLSNVFAWLLDAEGTHELGDAFQRIFVEEVNRKLRERGEAEIAEGAFGVRQEVNTAQPGKGADIADIVLDGGQTTLVIENYYTSDGHGHCFKGYERFGASQHGRGVVVLLCEHDIQSALVGGWEGAAIVLYATLLDRLYAQVQVMGRYRSENLEQFLFIENMHRHFTNRMALTMNRDGLVNFVDAMCRAGEAETFGQQPLDAAARALGDRLREEAIQRFAESRELLTRAKIVLGDYSKATLRARVNAELGGEVLGDINLKFSGVHLWTVGFGSGRRAEASGDRPLVLQIVLGPSAWHALNKGRWPGALVKPDYSRAILLVEDERGRRALQSEVSLTEIIEGLAVDDHRLRNEVVEFLR